MTLEMVIKSRLSCKDMEAGNWVCLGVFSAFGRGCWQGNKRCIKMSDGIPNCECKITYKLLLLSLKIHDLFHFISKCQLRSLGPRVVLVNHIIES
jgi:hypothetical protein